MVDCLSYASTRCSHILYTTVLYLRLEIVLVYHNFVLCIKAQFLVLLTRFVTCICCGDHFRLVYVWDCLAKLNHISYYLMNRAEVELTPLWLLLKRLFAVSSLCGCGVVSSCGMLLHFQACYRIRNEWDITEKNHWDDQTDTVGLVQRWHSVNVLHVTDLNRHYAECKEVPEYKSIGQWWLCWI